MKHLSKLTKTIIAWNGGRPVYATEALLEWRAAMAKLRMQVEADPDNAELKAEYYRLMAA